MIVRLLAVVAVFGTLPLPRQARAVTNSQISSTRSPSSSSSLLNSYPKSKYPRRSTYMEYPDEYFMYYPQEAPLGYSYYPYADSQPYYPPESSYYPKSYYPFDVPSVPVSAYPYYFGLQSPYAYYPADMSDRYPLEDDERWYDKSSPRQGDSNADVNAAFLRNLIVAQMYNDATNRDRNVGAPIAAPVATPTQNRYGQDIVYGEPVAYARNREMANTNTRSGFSRYVASRSKDDDDEDVRELKSLIKSKKSDGRVLRLLDDADMAEDEYDANGILDDVLGELYYKDELNEPEQPPKNAWGALLFGDDPLPIHAPTEKADSVTVTTPRVPTVTRRTPSRGPSTPAPTTASAAAAAAQTMAHSGQKEEAMLRPPKTAHPQRNTDSVFDTIRHLLVMDRALSQQNSNEPAVVPVPPQTKRQPQKRYVMTDKSLTEELNALKKTNV